MERTLQRDLANLSSEPKDKYTMKATKYKATIYKSSENSSSRIEVTFKEMETTVPFSGKINPGNPVQYRKFQHPLLKGKREFLQLNVN